MKRLSPVRELLGADLFVFGQNDLRLSVHLIERLFGLGQFHLLKAILYRDRDLQAF